MFLTALALVGSTGLAAAHPFTLSSRDIEPFPAGTSWDIVLNGGGSIDKISQVIEDDYQVIDIDLFDTSKETISDLKASKKVICYFSAGSQEGWRSDSDEFKNGDVGNALDGWPDEKWVDVKSDNVRNIMKKRIKMAAENGCTAIDPDNVDGFSEGQDGFGYDKSAYVDYLRFLAQEAQTNNLAIGLKNAVDLIPEVVNFMQFAINEQCHEFRECDQYKPFTAANKAVFNIEYGGKSCESPSGVKLSTLIKPADQGLNTLGGVCAGGQNGQPPAQPQSSNKAGPNPTSPVPSPSLPAPSLPTPLQPTSSRAVPSQSPTPTQTSAPQPAPTSRPTPTSAPEEAPDPIPSRNPWDWDSRPWGYHWGKNRWGP